MKRRLLLALAALGLATVACAQLPGARAVHKVSAAQLHEAVGERFPLRYPVAGLLDLEVKPPNLRLLPERNRLAAEIDIRAAGPALRQSYDGSFEVEFALRYEASDRTVRAHQIQVKPLRLPGLPARTIELLEAYLPALVRDALAEVVVHRLQARDLALADAMGLQPDSITVTQDGLEIAMAPAGLVRP